MSDTTVEDMIQEKKLTAPRITPERIQALCDRVSHTFEVQGTATFCHAFLDGKFYLASGFSACVSPENFDLGIGRKIAFENMSTLARNKLWELEGYRLYADIQEIIQLFKE